MESLGNLEEALKYYQEANETLSLVRMHCFLGNMKSVYSTRFVVLENFLIYCKGY
jgi:hypothetical protein